MKHIELKLYLRQKRDTVELQFALVILATFALSIQTQGSVSDPIWIPTLITGWTAMLIASALSLIRLYHSVTADQLDFEMTETRDEFLEVKQESEDHFRRYPEIAEEAKLERLKRFDEVERKMNRGFELLQKFRLKGRRFATAQIVCYSVGVLLNFIHMIAAKLIVFREIF